jgi:glucose-1-phosphate cytidylyltransferase
VVSCAGGLEAQTEIDTSRTVPEAVGLCLAIQSYNMRVVLLCGGKGSRLREETEYRPKPMLPIGNRPILWHIMKIYAAYGHKEFIVCLGYKGEVVREYFRNYLWHTSDSTFTLGRPGSVRFHQHLDEEDWTLTLADTGLESLTAYRVRQIRGYLGGDSDFLLTYGDGVGDINTPACVEQHRRSGKIVTITAVHPPGRFGELKLDANGQVNSFNEKPQVEDGLINGGFMVCSRQLFDYLPDDPQMMLEQAPLRTLATEGKLGAYVHRGFWQPMDTAQEFRLLNNLWEQGNPPWKVW